MGRYRFRIRGISVRAGKGTKLDLDLWHSYTEFRPVLPRRTQKTRTLSIQTHGNSPANVCGLSALHSIFHLAEASVNTKFAALNAFARYLLEKKLHRKYIARELRTEYVNHPPGIARLSSGETRRLVTSVDFNKQNGILELAIIQLFVQVGCFVFYDLFFPSQFEA